MSFDAWLTDAPDPGTVPDLPELPCPFCNVFNNEPHSLLECPLASTVCRCGCYASRIVLGIPRCEACWDKAVAYAQLVRKGAA